MDRKLTPTEALAVVLASQYGVRDETALLAQWGVLDPVERETWLKVARKTARQLRALGVHVVRVQARKEQESHRVKE